MRAAEAVLELLYPRKCLLCGALLNRSETDLCRSCRTQTEDYARYGRKIPNIRSFTAVWYYEDRVRESLLRYKFYNVRCYAPAYARVLAMRIQEELDRPEVLTWVPVSRLRRMKRGYDQVELIAKAVGKDLGIPCVRAVRKIRSNRPQSGLKSAAERRANVLGVYEMKNPQLIRGKRVLLLDDILTTGATASECARVILTAGAEEVLFAAVAAGRNQNE